MPRLEMGLRDCRSELEQAVCTERRKVTEDGRVERQATGFVWVTLANSYFERKCTSEAGAHSGGQVPLLPPPGKARKQVHGTSELEGTAGITGAHHSCLSHGTEA